MTEMDVEPLTDEEIYDIKRCDGAHMSPRMHRALARIERDRERIEELEGLLRELAVRPEPGSTYSEGYLSEATVAKITALLTADGVLREGRVRVDLDKARDAAVLRAALGTEES